MTGDRLRILQVSPSDIGGGAERVAADLHMGLLQRGHDSWLALGANHSRFSNSLQIPNNEMRSPWARAVLKAAGLFDLGREPTLPPVLRRAARFVAEPRRYTRVLRGHEDFDFPGTSMLPDLPPSTPDVIHLHNLHGAYFDIRALPMLTARMPAVLTMHDAWFLTGHCAYPIECERWLTGCGECPALDRYVPIRRDVSAENLRVKREALRGGRLRLATPSRWLMDIVRRSSIGEHLVETRVIPNGVDPATFFPGDRSDARARLGLPPDALIIVFAARSPKSSQFKGFETLESALPLIARGLEGTETLMLAVGEQAPDTRIGAIPERFVAFVEEPRIMADYYRAADLYLHPARAENFPLAVLEAMACGIAVIASDVGGIPEMVIDGKTGLLFADGNPEALAEAALATLRDPERRERFATAGVRRVRAEFTLKRQIDDYLGWYRDLVAPPQPR